MNYHNGIIIVLTQNMVLKFNFEDYTKFKRNKFQRNNSVEDYIYIINYKNLYKIIITIL